MSYDDLSFSEDEALAFLLNLMPQGFAGEDVMSELAPEGWEQCELVRAFHPTDEQLEAEERAHREQFGSLGDDTDLTDEDWDDGSDVPFPESEPMWREDKAIQPEPECRDLVGRILWEVLAEDHTVIANDGRRIDLGDYNAASSVLDLYDLGEVDFDPEMEDWIDMWDRGNSIRFSCDLAFIEGRANYVPVYEMIFRRMQALGADWIYQFPKLNLYAFEIPENPRQGDAYSPVESYLDELRRKEALEECERKQAKLDAINQEAAEQAAKEEPPEIVRAYMNVFGRRPSGWPPA